MALKPHRNANEPSYPVNFSLIRRLRWAFSRGIICVGIGLTFSCSGQNGQPETPLPNHPEHVVLGGSPVTEEWVLVPQALNFEGDNAELTGQTQNDLRELFQMLSTRTDIVRIRVVGFIVDEDSEQNNNLARDRSQAIIDWFVEQGIATEVFENGNEAGVAAQISADPNVIPGFRNGCLMQILVRRQAPPD